MIDIGGAKDRDEVGTPEHHVYMNNSGAPCNRLYNPHTHILIWPISHTIIPVNEGAGIFNVLVREGEEQTHSCDV